MQLRVFSGKKQRKDSFQAYVELFDPAFDALPVLFCVPLLDENDSRAEKSAARLRVRFEQRWCLALCDMPRGPRRESYEPVGRLSERDSDRVMGRFLDLLHSDSYPAPE